ncbi:MAG: site-2 protease family protein [Treponema sp.]|nr:site-2 protease family protein [Treponema sp.]
MTIIIGIILLGFLVFIHEAGHFIASRLCGVKVEAFSLGMGPVLFHKTIKGTDWRLSLLPFGGYCAMKGEKDFEESFDGNVILEKDSFYGVRPIFRAIIAFSGPLANFLFSVFAFFVIALTGYTYYSAGNTIRLSTEEYPHIHSAAADAGLLSGDKIIQINDKKIHDFSELYEEVATHPDQDIRVFVERDGKNLEFLLHTDLNKDSGEGKIGVMSDPSSVIARQAPRFSFFPAIGQGFYQSGRLVFLSMQGFASLFKGVNLTNSVAGPARITSMMGETAKSGFSAGLKSGIVSVLNFMALICISLFIMNLLPIPILDGYLLLSSLIEAIFNFRLSPKVRNIVQYMGIALIALLFFFALRGDFHYFAELLNAKK